MEIARIMSYRDEHVSFVSNLKGTSIGCIVTCLAHSPCCILLVKLVQRNTKPMLLRDMFYFVIPLLLNMTVLADQCYWTLGILTLIEIIYVIKMNRENARKFDFEQLQIGSHSVEQEHSSKLNFLTLFKGK